MCIILTCEKFTRPDYVLVEDCFFNNPDGAGIMWVEYGKVQIAKGYTNAVSLMSAIDAVPLDSPLVIHMRIATSGGIDVGTCHPFPITRNLGALHASDVECDAAIAHNGIIYDMPTDDEAGISDTVSFVMHLAGHWHGKASRRIKRRIRKEAPDNRFAILTRDAKVTRVGDGWETVTDGICASNHTWTYGFYYDDMMEQLGYGQQLENMPKICMNCDYRWECAKNSDYMCFASDEDEDMYDEYGFLI